MPQAPRLSVQALFGQVIITSIHVSNSSAPCGHTGPDDLKDDVSYMKKIEELIPVVGPNLNNFQLNISHNSACLLISLLGLARYMI